MMKSFIKGVYKVFDEFLSRKSLLRRHKNHSNKRKKIYIFIKDPIFTLDLFYIFTLGEKSSTD